MIKQPTAKNTKAQILDAFEQLFGEHQHLQAEYSRLLKEKEALEKTALEPRVAPATAEQRKGTTATPSQHTMDTILNSLAMLRAGFGSAISELSARLTAEATRLEELRRQAEGMTSQLSELHALAVTENTLDELITEYRAKCAAFDEKARQGREAFEHEMTERRDAWRKEQEDHKRIIKERNELLRKERQREREGYKYDLEQSRRLDEQEYEQKKQALHRELEGSVETKEREWVEREEAIAERERGYQELKGRAESLPSELETAIRRAQREGTQIAQRHSKTRQDLLAKEEEGDRRVAELRIRSLEETVKKQAQEIKSLSAQLGAVVKQDHDLAVKAIEGASHATSFQSIREIALEQAKYLPKAT